METVKLEELKLTINALDEKVKIFEENKIKIVSDNAPKIQELINKKVEELADKIKEDAINEICGTELHSIDLEIEKVEYSKELLTSLIHEEPEQAAEEQESTDKSEELSNIETDTAERGE